MLASCPRITTLDRDLARAGVRRLRPFEPVSLARAGVRRLRPFEPVSLAPPRALVDGSTAVSVGVRPEKIRLREISEGIPSGHNRLSGVIRDASYLGVSTQYQVEARGGARLTVFEQNVERATRSELWEPGEEVQLTWSPDHSFVIAEADPTAGVTNASAAASSAPAAPGSPESVEVEEIR